MSTKERLELNPDQIIKLYKKGQRVFNSIGLADGASMADCKLEGSFFEDCFFSSINFQNSNLKKTIFRNCNLKCSDFTKADFRESTIEDCLVEAIIFTDSNTEALKFTKNWYYGFQLDQEDLEKLKASKFV